MLLKEIKNIFHLELDDIYPKEEVDSFFYILIEHYLDLERFVLAFQPDLTISKKEEQPLFEALAQLKLHRPIQYVTGKTTFMNLEFYVDENVLVPRPETEELCRWIIEEIRDTRYEVRNMKKEGSRKHSELTILDIGTGSGCIAISLAKNIPGAKVYALDVSEKALEVTRRNAEANQVAVEFIEADILSLSLNFELALEFDIVVSNPPYVRELEMKEMSKNVLDHEPGLALFVPDEDPLRFYKFIIEFAQRNLNEGGTVYFEINQYLAKETKRLLEENNFQDIELRKDVFGNYRMLKGRAP